jgi:hypothetical protein
MRLYVLVRHVVHYGVQLSLVERLSVAAFVVV